MARFQLPIAELLLDFGDEILDCVRAHRGVKVDDIRDKLLGPLREYVHVHLVECQSSSPADGE